MTKSNIGVKPLVNASNIEHELEISGNELQQRNFTYRAFPELFYIPPPNGENADNVTYQKKICKGLLMSDYAKNPDVTLIAIALFETEGFRSINKR